MPKKNNEFLILGSIIVGLFVLLGVTNVDFSSFIIEEAQATHEEQSEEEYPSVVRNATTQMTMFDEKHGVLRMGLPTHIEDNQGDYVANLFYEDVNGVELESGTIAYYFDKNSCAMSLFNSGRINSTSVPIVKGDMWVVKVAPNGTDNWTDISQNTLPCEVTTTFVSDTMYEINSTKSDAFGTIQEMYIYDKYKGMKHDMWFFNNDPSLTNHKFSFSNILQDVPNSYMTQIVEETLNHHFHENDIVDESFKDIDLGIGVIAGDVLRSTIGIPVKINDEIVNATVSFITNSTEHEAGNGTAILYDQNLNLIATSDEIAIGKNVGNETVTFPFSPRVQINQTSATSLFLGLFFDDSDGKVVAVMESFHQNATQIVYSDLSNVYPIAPDPFSNDLIYMNNTSVWFELGVNGLAPQIQQEWYSQYQPQDQNFLFGGEAKVLDTLVGETIEYTATEFNLNTRPDQEWHENAVPNSNGFMLLQKTSSPDPNKLSIHYDFEDGLEKLWAVKFVSNPDFTLDVYIDYANVTTTTPVGGSIHLDPVINFPSFSDRVWSGTFSTTCGAAGGTGFESVTTGVASATNSGASATCAGTYVRYDTTSIPDNAVPVRLTFQINVTSGVAAMTNPFAINPSRVFGICGSASATCEDISGVSLVAFANAFGRGGLSVIDPTALTSFGGCCAVGVRTATLATPTLKALIDFELQLESGRNYQQYAICPNVFGGGCSFNGAVISRTNQIVWERFGASFFEVEFEFFDTPDPPEPPITATFSTSPDQCRIDWEQPLNDGGRVVTGFQVERSTGGSFQIIVADTGFAIPTQFDDTTITSGVSHTYRVSAINLEGVGAPSIVSNGCGFPELPTAPISLVATNVALGTVALEWSPPFFDGNSPITGYQIDRTFGVIPVVPNAVWEIREHKFDGSSALFTFSTSGTTLEIDDGVSSKGSGTIFKVFNKNDIINKNLEITWSMDAPVGIAGASQIRVFDGSYDRTSFTDFPSPATDPVLKGSGILHTFSTPVAPFATTTNFINMTLAGSTLPQVTIMIRNADFSLTAQNFLNVDEIEILSYNKWTWGSGSSVNLDVTGTDNDQGTTTAGSSIFDVNGVNDFFTLSANTGNSLTEFIDSTVVVDTQFGYRLFAINAIGTSVNPSNVAIITTVGLPDPPSNVNAVATGTSTIQVSWTAPDVGASTIEGYQIDRKQGVGGIFTTINPFTGNDDTTFGDALLASGTEFCYRLKTFTNIGLSTTFSGEDCATTQAQSSPPQNLVATALDGSTINVTWNTPLDDGGSAITGYKIERQKEALAFEILFAERQPESNRIFLDTGREVGTQYTYRISAITGFGQGVSALATATTDATPTPPQNFACSPASTTSINLSWDTPLSFSPATGYQIDRKSVGGSFSTIVADTGTTETTFLNDGLTVDSIFVYRVLGKTAEGDTDFTAEITCSTLSAPDSPPENVRGDFSEVIPHQTVLAWDIPDTFGIPITEFRIERDDGAGYLEIGSVTGSSIAFIDQQLDSDIDQRYRIITVGTEGETVPSIAIPFDTNQRSHWHYEGTIDDTGEEKNTGTLFGTANFNGTGHIGKAFIFDSTRIEVDQTQESDYDFDLNQGFGITTFFDGTPSIGQGVFTQNNTFSFTLGTDGRVFNTVGNTVACDSQTTITKDFVSNNMRVGASNLASFCIKTFGEFDISTISSSNNTVTSVEFRADVTGDIADTRTCTFASLESQPSIASALTVYNDIGDGTDFVTNVGNPICDDPAIANNVVVNLGSLAVANLQAAFDIGQTWWGVGLQFTDQVRVVETDHLLTHGADSYEIRINYTSPVVGGTPVFTDEWQIKEQQVLGANDSGCSMTASATDLNVDISFVGLSHCQLFKVFNKADIIGETLDVTWAGTSGIGINAQILVLDGSYDRNNPFDFPLNVGSTGFREGITGLKGGGILHSVLQGGTSFTTTTDSILMTLAGSELPQVTIVVKIRDGSAANAQHLDLEKIDIVGVDSWTWDSSATVTGTFDSADFNSAVTNANFTGNTLVAGGTGSVDQVIISKAETMTDVGYKFYIDSTGLPSVKLTNTNAINEIFVQSPVNVTDSTEHFIGFGYNGNQSASGVSWNVDGDTNSTIITDTLSGSILNNFPLTIGGTSTGTNLLNGTLDETRVFGTGTLDEDQLDEVANDKLDTLAPINATMTISGSTFANISGEIVIINMTSGFPLPVIGTIALDNFTATEVNAIVPVGSIDPITGLFVFDRFFNIMGSLSNYTADTTLTNAFEAFPLLSNFDIQSPVFTFLGDFFFQQARNPTFDVLSFNFTQTSIPFDLTCNLKATLFGNGTTFEFTDVFFIQELFDVDPQLDVVVACIDPNTPPIDPTAPSFGGSNALLSFVSFGDTTGIGNFLNFTQNFGDFFGAGLPFLFIIILAAAFTGRSAPTGIIIIGVALGAMWFLGIIEQDPIMWGIIVVLIVLGALAGKKFL